MSENGANDEVTELFVCGRLCILGEHSDWAGCYRHMNESIAVGQALVCLTNEGLFARCSNNRGVHSPSTDQADKDLGMFTFISSGCSSSCTSTNANMSVCLTSSSIVTELTDIAKSRGFFAYIAGTLLVMMQLPQFKHKLLRHGLLIDNYRTSLPVGKGDQ